MADIHDLESLEAWLEEQPREVAVSIAARAALRALPMSIPRQHFNLEQFGSAALLWYFRATATAWVSGAWPSRANGVRAAADRAARESYSADTAVNAVAYDAAAAAASTRHSRVISFAAAAAEMVARAPGNASEYKEIDHDANIIKNGGDTYSLSVAALWHDDTFNDAHRRWAELLESIPDSLNDNWTVWIDWYEDRLKGAAGSRPVIEELEVARVLIPDEEWEQGPAHVNALIKLLEDEHRRVEDDEARDIAEAMVDLGDEIDEVDFEEPPELPAQSSAVIEVETREDGRLHRVSHSPPKTKSEAQANRLRSAWRALEQTLSDLERLNINAPGLPQVLASYRRALGGAFENVDAVELGFHGRRIEEYAQEADDFLLGAGKAELIALAANHGMVINQLPEWAEYNADLGDEPSEDANDAAVEAADALIARDDLLADDVREPLQDVADAARRPLSAGPEDRVSPHIKAAARRVITNVLIGLLEEPLMLAHRTYQFGKEHVARGVGMGLSGWAAKETFFTSDAVKAFILAFPEHAWAQKAIDFIKMVIAGL